jgi:predicted metal-dependent hydrolase
MSQSPAVEYRRLNKLLWQNRLPKAMVSFIDDDTMPNNFGITMWDEDFVLPIIFINASTKRWHKVLIHEMCHVAEPNLPHGKLFFALVQFYVRQAKNTKKGYRTL